MLAAAPPGGLFWEGRLVRAYWCRVGGGEERVTAGRAGSGFAHSGGERLGGLGDDLVLWWDEERTGSCNCVFIFIFDLGELIGGVL